ncbi:hypothetical protein JQX13_42595 [Archangium violaceum]|uniref:hypothetical protein n=1 Tax=Archangium violaceum TaxID=83451 RepID=UPI00193BC0CD|nr:hypothetical protein [Archangium violaceum]QRK06699.1 hypothetical protein JQX13_42595 [Archangium violaceum]
MKQTKAPSLRSVARQLGVSLSSLQAAIASGRVTATPDGKVADVETARAEWIRNTRAEYGPAPLAGRGAALEVAQGESRAEALRRRAVADADLRELEVRERKAELVPAADVRGKLEDVFRRCRTKLLGVPSRARQLLPHLTVADIGEFDRLIREALEDLAGEGANTTREQGGRLEPHE